MIPTTAPLLAGGALVATNSVAVARKGVSCVDLLAYRCGYGLGSRLLLLLLLPSLTRQEVTMCEFCGLDGACAVCGVKHPTGEVLAVCRRYEWFRSHGVAQCAAVDYARAESWFDSVEWRYSGDPSWGASYPPGTVHHWHRIQWHKGTPILMRWDNLQQVWRGVGSSELVAAPHTPMGRILAAQLVSEVLKA